MVVGLEGRLSLCRVFYFTSQVVLEFFSQLDCSQQKGRSEKKFCYQADYFFGWFLLRGAKHTQLRND